MARERRKAGRQTGRHTCSKFRRPITLKISGEDNDVSKGPTKCDRQEKV